MKAVFGLSLAAVSAPALAQTANGSPGEIVVTAPAERPGLAVPPDRLPAASETLDAASLRRGGATDLLHALDAQAAGVTLDEAQGNGFQPNLLYRGYEASPLGGNAQGLAVYVDGARFNSSFGDTMNWDLIPDIAIDRIALEGSNPVFGLNALGGAISIGLKTGRDFHSLGAEASIGRYGRRAFAAEAGGQEGAFSAYLAADIEHDDGWRQHSPSTVKRLYGQIGIEGDWGHVDLRLMGADTSLTGNGTAPVELLDARYDAVFTYPDLTMNRYGRAELSADLKLGPHLRLKPVLYVSRLDQRTENGDLSDAQPCDGDEGILCLNGDDSQVVTDSAGAPFPAFLGDGPYAQLNETRARTTAYGGSLELLSDAPLGRFANHVALGASFDGGRTGFFADSLFGALAEDRGFADPRGVIDMAGGPIRPVDVIARRADSGLFATEMFSPTPNVDLTISARYNRSSVRLADRIGTDLNGRHNYERLNPAIGAVWRLGGGLSLYGGYSEANRAPTPAELSCANADAPCSLSAFFVDDPDLRQVVSRTWEAGLRGHEALGGAKIAWRVGGWRSTNDDDILFTSAATLGRAFFRNVGRTRRQGIEAELQVEAKSWSARASYVLTDATFRTGFVEDSPQNPAADANGEIAIVTGDRIPGIPRHRLKAGVTRRFGKWAWLTVEGQVSSGRWLLGDEANLTAPTAGYWLANASAGVRPAKGIELFAEIDNLFDRKYATFGGFTETAAVAFAEAPGIANPRALSPGTPRTWLIGARARF